MATDDSQSPIALGTCPECGHYHGTWEACETIGAMMDDIAAILRAVELGDHARPVSAHRVVRDEIIPAIERLRAAATAALAAPRPADAAAVGDCIGLGAKCARPCGPDGRCAQADVRDAPKVAAAHSHLLDLVLSRKYSGASLQKAIRAVIDAAASAALATPPAADARGAEIARLRDMLTRVAETQMALAVDDADHQRAAFGSEDAQPSTDAERERIEEDADGALGAVLAWWEARRAAGGEVR